MCGRRVFGKDFRFDGAALVGCCHVSVYGLLTIARRFRPGDRQTSCNRIFGPSLAIDHRRASMVICALSPHRPYGS